MSSSDDWSVYTYTYIPTVEVDEHSSSGDMQFSISDDRLFGSSDGMREKVEMCDQAVEVSLDREILQKGGARRIETQVGIHIPEPQRHLSFSQQVITNVIAGGEDKEVKLVKVRKVRRKVRRVRVKRKVPIRQAGRETKGGLEGSFEA